MDMIRILSIGVALAAVTGCGRTEVEPRATTETQTPTGWVEIVESEFDDSQRQQLVVAVTAQQEMASTLMAELQGELASGGPAGAVVVCRDLAPMIAEHISAEHELAIGRTSHKLRNPTNTPPEWAVETVDRAVGDGALFAGPAGELGVLSPIRVAAPCLACHGPAEDLSEEVTASLAESYPEDEAVGFAEGDLRGWFWVEVPAGGGEKEAG